MRRWAVALSELPKMVNSQCNDPNGTRYLLGLTNTFIDRAGAVRGQPLARVGYEVVWERAKLAIDGAFLPGPPPFTTPLSVNDLGVSTPTGGNAFWIGDGATEWFMHYVVAHEILHALLGNYENGQVSPWERACYRSRNIHRNPGVGGYAGQAASWDSGAARSIWTGNDYNGPVSLGIGTPFRMAALYERALRRGLVVPSDCSLVER